MIDGYAMQFDRAGLPLRRVPRTFGPPDPEEVLLEVLACGVCRTDLHVADGEVAAHYPIVPGHEVVGRVVAVGSRVTGIALGARLGVPWLGGSCGHCRYCLSGRENLCETPVFTGATRDGGYATHCLADARYCLPIPDAFADAEAAPLLCAGLIGYRALVMAGDADTIALYGFGAAAHIVAQVANWRGRRVFALTRPGDAATQAFARRLGCTWAGGSDRPPPEEVDAAIIFAADGALVPAALRAVRKGGRVVCAGIHMSDIPAFPYADLWGERALLSVANLTRADGAAFFAVAQRIPVRTTTRVYRLADANTALDDLRAGRLEGAAVLVPR
ncbi:zinc-dependent alcohol dehydrogenase family protein [Sphingomonas cannabina]|uniref:zinc-dependent alcohol dehydrogenase family protein n=1 Tax=Sphingomonas cannabina TaxID=2899123 RepID=UPI001F430FE6|nr:zinc-dependent alcohol dehydrogenase family protein [Sphingomonas cannabina]UIJ46326.1 zinc-dependent alcohol dehydrogenase family protein [Sphingomonas cannabina]